MTTITEQASILADLHRNRAQLQIELGQQESLQAECQLKITPAEGWPGKNEEQRKTARELAYASDEVLRSISSKISEIRDTLTDCEAEVSAHQELASAARWEIRARLAEALLKRTNGDKHEDAALSAPEFDQAAQSEIDEAVDLAFGF
jgi:hypothetical protein